MTRISEKRDVQDQLINYLIGIGWHYLPPADVMAMRGEDLTQPLLPDIAHQKLLDLNPGLVTAENIDDVLRRLQRVHPSMAGNEDFLKALRGHWTLYDPKEKRERNLTLIDYDSPKANHFAFTQEFAFQDRDVRRADLLLFVNGLPVLLVENKSPAQENAEWEAFDQVQRLYTERIPELLKFVQFFAACNLRLHYGPTWNDSRRAFYRWKTDHRDVGLERLSKSFFDREQVLRALRDYLIFFRADDQTNKYVLRPHQMRAVERMVQRVADNIGRKAHDLFDQPLRSGLVWHTQGSGKSLTMIIAAHKLRRLPSMENPTLLIVVDRRELETQMAQNLEAFGFPAVQRAESKEHLRDLLASDYRGMIVTLIHKFDRMPKRLNDRDNVVLFVDEAHRSQEGDLATYMRAALPNAFYFGLTGTPIDRGKVGRGTFETFGRADDKGYLDKYGIGESIDDGTTVPLYYTLALSELRVDRETLENEFFRLVEESGVASIEELDRLLDKADKLKAVLKSEDRVDKIAAHIAEHYRENVEPLGFKAFVVTVDREACALYKEALNRYLPPEYSRVVYTATHKDGELLRQFHLDDTAEKEVRKAFRDAEQLPKVLIVTQKLLTGYDAPVLYAMYLDKPLKDHTLLQAIARVNRPFENKPSGLVVDYIGIFEDLQRALAFDAEDVATGLVDLDRLKARFSELMAQAREELAAVDAHRVTGRMERIIERYFEPRRREAFYALYRETQQAYEILSPDPFLRDYLEDYALLTQVYQVVYDKLDPESAKKRLERELLFKTEQLIKEHVEVHGVLGTLEPYEINRDIAKVISRDNVSERVKIANLHRSLVVHIERNAAEQPYLISIAERVEAVIQQLQGRQISAQLALEQLTAAAEDIVTAQEEQQKSDLSSGAFALYWVLRAEAVTRPKQTAQQAHQILEEHANWPHDSHLERKARLELWKLLYEQRTPERQVKEAGPGYGIKRSAEELKQIVDNLLRMHRIAAG